MSSGFGGAKEADISVPSNTLVAATRRGIGGLSVAVYGLVNSRFVFVVSVIT
jgi:hypothetical protein